ncbi:GNAT family N-acetyltransferase [Streptomyces sp. NPDC004787]|uniref:GNAT family N-acetyltransferase n=1 Tax=Streptomyces sp. NPDC004787 TaxID=3154291 RepID=UPI0033B05852
MFPDVERRKTALPAFFRAYVDLALERGRVWLLDDALAAAVTFPSDLGLSDGDQRELDQQVRAACGQDARTAMAVMDMLDEHHPHSEPHQYLLFITVRPEHQRRGYGGALLKQMTEHWDQINQPGYLEATCPSNRALYQRHGFSDVGAPLSASGSPELYPMWRAGR